MGEAPGEVCAAVECAAICCRCWGGVRVYILAFVTFCKSCAAEQFNTLQHDATRCNTLQHAATRCTTLQHAATRCTTLQHTARINVLQCVVVCCSVLQCVAVCCSVAAHRTSARCSVLQSGTACCSFGFEVQGYLKSVAMWCSVCNCNTLQHSNCNTLQYTAT